jgi:hypothetical protein
VKLADNKIATKDNSLHICIVILVGPVIISINLDTYMHQHACMVYIEKK